MMNIPRKKLYIIGGSVLGAILLIAGIILLVRGCGSGKGQAVPRANYEAEYQSFLQSGFNTPEEAADAAAAWMGRFIADGNEEKIAETQAILDCFLQMQDFFAREFPSDRSFRSQMNYMGTRFTDSPYPVVRKTWLRVSSRAVQGLEPAY